MKILHDCLIEQLEHVPKCWASKDLRGLKLNRNSEILFLRHLKVKGIKTLVYLKKKWVYLKGGGRKIYTRVF